MVWRAGLTAQDLSEHLLQHHFGSSREDAGAPGNKAIGPNEHRPLRRNAQSGQTVLFRVEHIGLRTEAVNRQLNAQRRLERGRSHAPWGSVGTREQDKASIEQIQRGDAFLPSLKP